MTTRTRPVRTRAAALAATAALVWVGAPAVAVSTPTSGPAAVRTTEAPGAHSKPGRIRWFSTKVGGNVKMRKFRGTARLAFRADKGTLVRLENFGPAPKGATLHRLTGAKRLGAKVRTRNGVARLPRTGRYAFSVRSSGGTQFQLLGIERRNLSGGSQLDLPVIKGTAYEVSLRVPTDGDWAARVTGSDASAFHAAYRNRAVKNFGTSGPAAIAFAAQVPPLFVDAWAPTAAAGNSYLRELFPQTVRGGDHYTLFTTGGTVTMERGESGALTPDAPAITSQGTSGLYVHTVTAAPGDYLHASFTGSTVVPYGSALVGGARQTVPGLERATATSHRMVTLTVDRPSAPQGYRVLRPTTTQLTATAARTATKLTQTDPGRWIVAPVVGADANTFFTYPGVSGSTRANWLVYAQQMKPSTCGPDSGLGCGDGWGGTLTGGNDYMVLGMHVAPLGTAPISFVVVPFGPGQTGSLDLTLGPRLESPRTTEQ